MTAHCPACDRDFPIVDDPTLLASYRCPVCLTPGQPHPQSSDDGDAAQRAS